MAFTSLIFLRFFASVTFLDGLAFHSFSICFSTSTSSWVKLMFGLLFLSSSSSNHVGTTALSSSCAYLPYEASMVSYLNFFLSIFLASALVSAISSLSIEVYPDGRSSSFSFYFLAKSSTGTSSTFPVKKSLRSSMSPVSPDFDLFPKSFLSFSFLSLTYSLVSFGSYLSSSDHSDLSDSSSFFLSPVFLAFMARRGLRKSCFSSASSSSTNFCFLALIYSFMSF